MSRFHVRWHLQSKFIKGKIISFNKFSTIYLEFFTTDCKKKITSIKLYYLSKSFALVSECRTKMFRFLPHCLMGWCSFIALTMILN